MITDGKAIREVRVRLSLSRSSSLLMMLHLLPSIKENVEELSEGILIILQHPRNHIQKYN